MLSLSLSLFLSFSLSLSLLPLPPSPFTTCTHTDPPDPPQNVQVLQTGAMWADIEWLPPDYVGPLPPLSFYEITAEPLYRNGTIIPQSDSEYSIPSHDSLEELEQAYLYDQNNGSLDLSFLRGFDPNTTCVEIICERIIVTVDAETTRFNLSGLIPAHSYNLIIRSLSNGTNLISDASDPITITTKPYGKYNIIILP